MAHHRPLAESDNRAADQIALRRVEVAAGGIDAQRPAHIPDPLPGREGQAVIQELRDAGSIQRPGRQRPVYKDRLEERVVPRRDMVERDQRRAGVTPERIGLRGPIEPAGPEGIALQMVLGRLMEGKDLVEVADCLHRKAEQAHVAVLHHILLAFTSPQALLF